MVLLSYDIQIKM